MRKKCFLLKPMMCMLTLTWVLTSCEPLQMNCTKNAWVLSDHACAGWTKSPWDTQATALQISALSEDGIIHILVARRPVESSGTPIAHYNNILISFTMRDTDNRQVVFTVDGIDGNEASLFVRTFDKNGSYFEPSANLRKTCLSVLEATSELFDLIQQDTSNSSPIPQTLKEKIDDVLEKKAPELYQNKEVFGLL